MGDSGDGWQTVMPTSQSAIERLSRSQIESYEKQTLAEWEAARGHWSGIGKHTPAQDFTEAKKLHARFKYPQQNALLGSGGHGVVEKVHYSHNNRTVCLARKHIKPNRQHKVERLREEAHVMEKLDHEHIVKLVGTYLTRPHELFILLWPAAVCNLDGLFNDIDFLREGLGDREDIISRLQALELDDISAFEQRSSPSRGPAGQGNCPLKHLQQITGCITQAVAYCHGENIRHLDLKPSNILLSPGRVYLADFGIAKDVDGRGNTMTMGLQGTLKWAAPEMYQCDDGRPVKEWSMKAADVYSLGLVLLNITTILYGATMNDFDAVLADLSQQGRAEKLRQYHIKLEGLALATQEYDDVNAPTFAPKHIVSLTSKMLSYTPSLRPVVDDVNIELVELGGIHQAYHSRCCKKSNRFVTDRMSSKFKVVVDERNRLRAEYAEMAKRLEILERKDETYETRIQNERRAKTEAVANIKEQLNKERAERNRLEGVISEMRKKPGPRPGLPRPVSDRSISNGSPAPGLMMRAKPHSYSLPVATPPTPSPSPSPAPQTQARVRAPTLMHSPRPTYSQTAAAAIVPREISKIAARRDSGIAIPASSSSPAPILIPKGSPSPDAVGFALRSRNSGSRLPRAVPSTPRSSTPTLNRDPSSTDSTQYSMTSSTFSRLSIQDSIAGTSIGGTPVIGSPAVNGTTKDKAHGRPNDSNATVAEATDYGVGLGITERSDSVATNTYSIHDGGSVASSSAIPRTGSPVFSGSAFSSPRTAHSAVDPPAAGIVRVPSLPTAPSWADVARRQKRIEVRSLATEKAS
ncbi:kinase-like domain-containing protein [Podospora didyma]|uniref:Kinase-like domain-containing protein n=1 Tax=Podospora didyma TaxID=330526 RepID=A0AAE0P7W4_9PEZI|nr:kinase-like domain-containing protein [Podospora didyma]